ncbi:hypothetical protein FQN55_008377 [Onygenales sp. PD_40]|nr:hypothetical protein FQN55_008377 [Onygenales sp. PD_40]
MPPPPPSIPSLLSKVVRRTTHRHQQHPRRRLFSTTSSIHADFTHAVIGGGVVGLAIARQLAGREGTSTLLIERHGAVGTETSSRNSEVIHAGLYYPPTSLKTTLCIRGKELLYSLCATHNIPHRRTGKWILAQDPAQLTACEEIHTHATSLNIPTHFLTPQQAHSREPSVLARAGILESPTTGIIDSHALMAYLQADLEERGGDIALRTAVRHIEPIAAGNGGFKIYTTSNAGTPHAVDEPEPIVVETLVNAAGHGACAINNMLLPAERHRTAYFAKGTYFSYAAATPSPKPATLLYPAPKAGLGGLGTHLTLDMAGQIRFGPDVEWVDSAEDLTPSSARLEEGVREIREFLPGIRREAVGLDYCGVRPKLAPRGAVGVAGEGGGKAGFVDFVIQKEEGVSGFVNLLGIESPGLTSSLAIGEVVEGLVYG